MADIFDEVEEGLRQERYNRLLREYGPIAAGIAAAVILGVAGREGWTAWRENTAMRSSEAFMQAQAALERGDSQAATEQLAALGKSGTRSYRALAKMQAAAVAAETGSAEEAARLYEEAAALVRDPLISDMARLKAAYLLADTLPLGDLEARLEPLMARGAPYETAARELLGAAALKAGDYDKAREAYTYLTVSLDAPMGVQRRAEEALAVIDAAEAAAPKDEQG